MSRECKIILAVLFGVWLFALLAVALSGRLYL
jgi:hypothetical protein